jgi:hypothetical protein
MQETFMDKVTRINSEVIGPEAKRSKLSLNKETLRQLKVRTGIKAGAIGSYACVHAPTQACNQPSGNTCLVPTLNCTLLCM